MMELEQLDEVGGRARLKPVAAELKGNEGFILIFYTFVEKE